MSEVTKIVLTASATILGGMLLYCATTLFQRLVLEPVFAVRKALGEVSFTLQYHAWVFHMSCPAGTDERFQKIFAERCEKVFDELRAQTARLRVEANTVLAYGLFVRLGWIPPYKSVLDASGCLIGLSNSLGREKWDQITEYLKTVETLLKIDIGRPKYDRGA
jgi:hypothetical protein